MLGLGLGPTGLGLGLGLSGLDYITAKFIFEMEIWTEFKSRFVAPTWTQFNWPWFSWMAMVIMWTTLIG